MTATDNSDSDSALGRVPPTGSLFPVGTPQVECTATDPTGNMATDSFDVTVLSDIEMIGDFRAQVQATVAHPYFRAQLLNYLDQALLRINYGQDQAAAHQMQLFITRVTAYRGTVLSPALADDFIAQAEQTQAALGYEADSPSTR